MFIEDVARFYDLSEQVGAAVVGVAAAEGPAERYRAGVVRSLAPHQPADGRRRLKLP